MYENLGSQFFRSITGIQSEPDAFEKIKFDCNLSKQFCFTISGLLSRGGIVDLLLLRTLLADLRKSHKPSFREMIICFVSISKFGSFKKTFAMVASLSELHF